ELDGDEDADRDGIDNEDEDDTIESCRGDDDDRDEDGVADEDENELGTSRSDSDSDDDGVADGNEDSDDDGLADEDEDDSDDDRCDGDLDDDGVDDEDEDVFGVVVSFDASTSTLEVNASGRSVSGILSEDTEIEWTDCDRDDEPTTADLTAGTGVEELEFDDETGLVEEVTLIPPAS
ncbi:MAG: hypothetical protein H0U89_01390, partial [Acidimicrobiia bacterium]|nr:hypothetical protein [Acidimicrobiia bacterium]